MAQRTLKDCMGERLLAVTEPWEGECEEAEMILELESGVFRIIAVDSSEQGRGASVSLYIEETTKRGD
jgi:hypothetical protein